MREVYNTVYLYHYVFDKYIGYATVGHATVELQQRGWPGLLFLRAECGCAFSPWGGMVTPNFNIFEGITMPSHRVKMAWPNSWVT